MMEMILLKTIILVLFFLTGYCLGRHVGQKSGMEKGQSLVPLLLRQKSLEQGYCVLCNKSGLAETLVELSSISKHYQ